MVQRDQLIQLRTNATLTEGIISQVLGLKTSREVWASLENAFAQQSQARVMDQLQSLN